MNKLDESLITIVAVYVQYLEYGSFQKRPVALRNSACTVKPEAFLKGGAIAQLTNLDLNQVALSVSTLATDYGKGRQGH